MNSEKNYFFKGLVVFTLFSMLYELSFYVRYTVEGTSVDLSIILEMVSFFAGLIFTAIYFILGLNEIGNQS